MAPPPAVYCRNRGFTLIEMLVSLALLGMVAAMLLNGLRTTSMFGQRSARQFGADETVIAAQRVLRDRIEQLRPIVDPDSAVALVDAVGDQKMFTFQSVPLARSEPDSLWRYRIILTPAGDLTLLTANSLDDRHDFMMPGSKGWQPMTLLKNVQSFEINYFGARQTGLGTSWQINWFQRPQPPALVRLRVAFRVGDRRVWPDLIVRPRATDNTACRIDVLTGRCGAAS